MFNVKIADIKLQENNAVDNLIKEFQSGKDTLDIVVDFQDEIYYKYFVKTIIYDYLKSASSVMFKNYISSKILLNFVEKHPEYKCIIKKELSDMNTQEHIKEFESIFFPKYNIE